jgi:hypothetical protein
LTGDAVGHGVGGRETRREFGSWPHGLLIATKRAYRRASSSSTKTKLDAITTVVSSPWIVI